MDREAFGLDSAEISSAPRDEYPYQDSLHTAGKPHATTIYVPFAAHCTYAEGVRDSWYQFRSTPGSTTSRQHLWLIASLGTAGKYNHI